jgi:hypothetical protein
LKEPHGVKTKKEKDTPIFRGVKNEGSMEVNHTSTQVTMDTENISDIENLRDNHANLKSIHKDVVYDLKKTLEWAVSNEQTLTLAKATIQKLKEKVKVLEEKLSPEHQLKLEDIQEKFKKERETMLYWYQKYEDLEREYKKVVQERDGLYEAIG